MGMTFNPHLQVLIVVASNAPVYTRRSLLVAMAPKPPVIGAAASDAQAAGGPRCRSCCLKGDHIIEKLYDLRETLCKELKELAEKRDLGAGDLEVVHKLTGTIKNIGKLCMMERDRYSEDGCGQGFSYANRGKHYVRGHYSRADGPDGVGDYSSRRDRRGRYSRDDGRSEMMEHLEMALDSASDQDRETIKRFMRQMENA